MKKAAVFRVEALERRQLLAATVPHFDHIVVVVEENHSFDNIIGSDAAPYLNSLAAGGALFTNSSAFTHTSLPNYLALFSGSTQGAVDDTPPSAPYQTPNLGAELLAAGDSFTGYSESLPSVGFLGDSSTTVPGQNQYVRRHNPWADWQSDTPTGNLLPASVNQPFNAFPSDFTTLPTVSFVVPNLQNDMHDGTVAVGDAWLQSNMQAYANWATTHNSLLIVTWDEDDGSDPNHIPTIFYGANVVTGNYAEPINHFNVLRTIEASDGLPDAGGNGDAPITDSWTNTVGPSGTTTVVTPSSDSAIYGQTLTFTAAVTSSAGPIPTGAVQFQIDGIDAGSPVPIAGGSAPYSTMAIGAGPHSITAVYSGDSNFTGSAASTNVTVSPKQVTGSVSVNNKVYDATTGGTISGGSLAGVLTGDSVSLAGGVVTYSGSKVSAHDKVTVTDLELAGPSASNYVLSNPTETTTAGITPRPLIVTADNFTRVYGEPNPVFTATVSGFIPADGMTFSETTRAAQHSRAGAYAITPVRIDPNHRRSNYTIKINRGSLTIVRADTITIANDAEASHGGFVNLTADVSASLLSMAGIRDGHVKFSVVGGVGNLLKTVNSHAPVKGLAMARLSLVGLAVGSYMITAVYLPDVPRADFNASMALATGTLTIT